MSHSPSLATRVPRAVSTTAIIVLITSVLLTLVATVRPVSAAPVDEGFKDRSWAASGSSVSNPSQDKPQSKVWFTDGFWWGALFTGADHNIHRYDAAAHTWTDTGVTVDQRNASHGDYMWDAATNSLYVASVNGDGDADPVLVFKLNYNPSTNTYSHDPDFGPSGLTAGLGPTETVTIAKDSTGQLWVTFQNANGAGRNIMVNRSLVDEHTWGVPFSIGTASGDDISAIIAFGGNSVGVMWSDQNPADNQTFFYWSQHSDADADTDWSTKQSSAQGTDEFAEDHVNLKLVATNSGQVLAAVKTNGGPDHIQLLSRNASTGNWTKHVVVGESQDVTRPQVVVDATNNRAYVFYTTPEIAGDGNQAIYYKSAALGTLSFNVTGLGTPFIRDGTNDINDISTSKHPVTEGMGGILGIATSATNKTYYHGWVSLGGDASPFDDVPTTHRFYDDIVWVYEAGITTGCNRDGTLFCPEDAVDRDQMATFLVRALDLSGGGSNDAFTDDDGNPHERNINILAHNGLTTGCGGGGTLYCPDEPVQRDQMATFLVRAYELTGGGSINAFTDDNDNPHERRINILAHNEITTGCGGTKYCPDRVVSRGQMAAFLHRAETR